jgi:mevalonate kinase
MSYDFQTTTHGKWILAGEHAVIRGHGALVFPILEKKLTLSYQASPSPLSAEYEGDSGADTHMLFWSVLKEGMQQLGQSLTRLKGHLHLYSDIPIGVGMGASAALCVATARWFSTQEMIPPDTIPSFAKQLEHLFHGQSSGLDIAGVAATSGIYFQKGVCSSIQQAWHPQWFLSSCEQVGVTSQCIGQVQALWQRDPTFADEVDQKMSFCAANALIALEHNTAEAQINLANAINTAADCFQQWGLISDRLNQHMQYLRDAGAIAVKPTGSGGGGYVVSLWNKHPPKLSIELMSVYSGH